MSIVRFYWISSILHKGAFCLLSSFTGSVHLAAGRKNFIFFLCPLDGEQFKHTPFLPLLYSLIKKKQTCGFLNYFQTIYRLMRLGLVYTQPLHEPTVLLRCQGFGFCLSPWPLETAGLQSLVQKDKTIAFPVQRLDAVPASAAEQK